MKIAKILYGLLLTGLSSCLFAGGGQVREESESVEGKRVRMTFANETVTIRPENTPAARALAARLEEGALTLTFSDFAGNEKIASPDPPLVFTDTEGCDPDAGDVTVYIPWGNLAAFILRRLYSDLFLLSEFKFMDFGESPFRFFVDSICMMILFAVLGWGLKKGTERLPAFGTKPSPQKNS